VKPKPGFFTLIDSESYVNGVRFILSNGNAQGVCVVVTLILSPGSRLISAQEQRGHCSVTQNRTVLCESISTYSHVLGSFDFRLSLPARETMTDFRAWVCNRLATLLGTAPEEIDLDKSIYDYDLDSVDAIIMAGELEEVFAVAVDPAAFLQFPTLRSTIAALERALATGGALDFGEEFVADRPAADEAAQEPR
jgi:acyl carrier protein